MEESGIDDVALEVATALRTENDLLRENYNKLRDEMVRLKAAADEARAQAGAEMDARAELQRHHDGLVAQWRAALEQREREMEDLQERMNPPRDLELLRTQIAEEMSASHAAHVAALKAEADGFRASLFELQRSYESARAEHEAFTQDQAREAEATHLAHQAAVAELQRTAAALQARIDEGDAAATAALRAARRDAEEKGARARLLQAEVDDLTADAERRAAREADAEQQRQAALGGLQARVSALAVDKAAAERRAAAAEASAAALTAAHTQLAARAQQAAAEASRLSAALSSRERAAAEDARRAAARLDDAEAERTAERAAMAVQIDDGRREIATLLSALSAAKDAAADDAAAAQRRLVQSEAALRARDEACAEAERRALLLEDRVARAAVEAAAAGGGRARLPPHSHRRSHSSGPPRSAPPSRGHSPGRPGAADSDDEGTAASATGLRLADAAARTTVHEGGGGMGGQQQQQLRRGGSAEVRRTHAPYDDEDADSDAAAAAVARAEGEAAALRRAVAGLRAEVTDVRQQLAAAQGGLAEQARRREEAETRAAAAATRAASLEAEAAMARRAAEDAEATALRKQQALAAAEARAETDAASAADLHAQQIAAVTRGCERLGKEMLERKEAYKRAYAAAARKAAAYKAKLVQLHGLFLRAQADASDAVEARNMIAASRDAELGAAMRQVKDLLREREVAHVALGGGGGSGLAPTPSLAYGRQQAGLPLAAISSSDGGPAPPAAASARERVDSGPSAAAAPSHGHRGPDFGGARGGGAAVTGWRAAPAATVATNRDAAAGKALRAGGFLDALPVGSPAPSARDSLMSSGGGLRGAGVAQRAAAIAAADLGLSPSPVAGSDVGGPAADFVSPGSLLPAGAGRGRIGAGSGVGSRY